MGRPKRSSSSSADEADELELGYVSGVFGVKGEVRLFLHHRESGLLDAPRDVVLVRDDGERFDAVLSARPGAGKRILGRIEGVDDRDGAASWQGARIRIPVADLPRLEEGEYYVWQLEGARVVVDGQEVGVITAVHPTGPIEVLEVQIGSETAFVPSLSEYVLELDLEQGRVVLAPEALDGGGA